jgi:probable rRNA maturation factor
MLDVEAGVQIDPEFQGRASDQHLADVLVRSLAEEGLSGPLTVGLLVTDDDSMRRLNAQYRGEDSTTDVLAFGVGHSPDGFVSPSTVPRHLGDLVVSYPRAATQAAEHGHSVDEELDRLVVHGILHLLGYQDHSEEERERMWKRQESMLREIRADA